MLALTVVAVVAVYSAAVLGASWLGWRMGD